MKSRTLRKPWTGPVFSLDIVSPDVEIPARGVVWAGG
jgi:hypothetical protein